MAQIDRSVIRAINQFARTPKGRKYDRWARKNEGLPGKILMAKTVLGENGGMNTRRSRKTGKRSSAGAFGPAQFIESTRNAYIEQYGVDPWKDDRSAIEGMAIHHMSTGVAGYNPGMPTYTSYIKGQKLDRDTVRALRRGGSGGGTRGRRGDPGTPGSLKVTENIIPGMDMSAQRDALKKETFLTALGQGRMPSMGELVGLGMGLRELKDIPDEKQVGLKFKPGKPGRAGRRGGRGGAGPTGALGVPQQDNWDGSMSVGLPVARMAKQLGLDAVSEKRGTVNTASGGVSDHYQGNQAAYAWDLSNGSAPTREMDKAAMRAAKMMGVGKQWKQQGRQGVIENTVKIKGRTYRLQMLYRTNVGGNHYNHVHFGVRRVS